jgi:hypothetical protein
MKTAEEDIRLSKTDRGIIVELTQQIKSLTGAVERLTEQVMNMIKKG